MAQREGRILRRGNNNKEIDIYKYVTKDTFDAYLYQTIEKKQQFISQIMTEKSPMRTVDDVDQSVLDYAEIKALCVGNPKIKEKMDLEQDLKKLNVLHSQYKRNLYRMETALLKTFPAQIKAGERNIENYHADLERLEKGTQATDSGISPMVIDGITFTERVQAGDAIKAACQSVTTSDGVKIGSYRGFELHLSFDKWSGKHVLAVRGDMPYPIKLEGNFSTQGVVTRIDNALEKIPEYIISEKEGLQNAMEQMKAAELEVNKPFPHEEEIKIKSTRVTLLNIELSLDAQKLQKAEAEVDAPEGTEHSTEEKEPLISAGSGLEEKQDKQVNNESIVENYEIAENGGQGAFVSGDIHTEKSTVKTPDASNAPHRPEMAASSGINAANASKEKAKPVIPLHLQPVPKTVKAKQRNYFQR